MVKKILKWKWMEKGQEDRKKDGLIKQWKAQKNLIQDWSRMEMIDHNKPKENKIIRKQ